MKQRLRSIILPEEDLELSPETVQDVTVETDIQRAFSFLLGKYGQKRIFLECTSGGILKVSAAGTIYETNEAFTGTTTNVLSAELGLTGTPSYIEIWTRTFDMKVYRTTDGVLYQDEIYLEKDSYYEINASTKDLKVLDGVADSHATYKIQCWR